MNIEKTISEHAVSDILTPMLESQDRIVTEDVAPLFDQATGLDTPPASGTVTTTIEESRSVISAIIRKAWTATLTMLGGASVISYIAAAYAYLRNRLQGNETYGIPDRRSEISASSSLAANLALLNDRKIGGVPEAEDGMPMARILCDSSVAATITEITDDTTGWTMNRENFMATLHTVFPYLVNITLNCTKISAAMFTSRQTWINSLNYPSLEEISVTFQYAFLPYQELYYAPKLKKMRDIAVPITGTSADTFLCNCKRIYFPELESIGEGISYPNGIYLVDVSNLESIEMPNLKYFFTWADGRGEDHATTKFTKFVVGPLTFAKIWTYANRLPIVSLYDYGLIHLELGDGTSTSLDLSQWSPTNAIDASRTDLIEEGSTAQNNLQQFLQNFRSFIAERLTDNGSGKTLTLSQAVFSEIWDSQGQPQVKGDGLDTLRADIHRIIRTEKQWAVNKA